MEPPVSPPAGAGPCLPDVVLAAMLGGQGRDPAGEAHLERCDACRQRLEALAGAGRLRIREAPPSGTLPSPLADAMAALRLERVPSTKDEQACGTGAGNESPTNGIVLERSERPGALGRFAGYEIMEAVASGGMGTVFKGFDPTLQRMVAIKVLSPALAAGGTARARFLREARAAAAVNHEHVVAIHAVGEEKGLPYLVMQFVSGRSLQARLDASGPLQPREILRIGSQAAYGLAAAHAQGLIHRDVKPGNILLENSVERVKLTDFGLARAAGETDVTRPGVVAGTPEYMAPEQARGEPLDPRADLFALGTVLYTIATGVSPFRAEGPLATLRKVCDFEPAPLHERNPDQPRELGEIVARLMSKRVADRYPDARTTASALESLLASLQSGRSTVGTNAADRFPTRLRGRGAPRWAWGFGVLLSCALAAGFFTKLIYRTPPAGTWTPYRWVETNGTVVGFTNLSAIVGLAARDGVLEFDWDGPRTETPIRIRDGRLHLRAAAGRRPVVVHASRTEPWLLAEAGLRMEGIEVRSEVVDAGIPVSAWGPGQARGVAEAARRRAERRRTHEVDHQLVVLRGGVLELDRCRLISASLGDEIQVPLFLENCREASLRNSEIIHVGGPGIAWKSTAGSRLVLSNCAVVARTTLFTTTSGTEAASFELHRCTVVGSFLVATVSGNENLRGWGKHSAFSIRRPSALPAAQALGVKQRWSGVGNAYERVGLDSLGALPGGEEGSVSVELGLDDRIRSRLATAGGIVSEDLALPKEVASRLGRPVGVDTSSLGPGKVAAPPK